MGDSIMGNDFNLGRYTDEVLSLKKDVGAKLIELGKKLIDVKNNLPRGEWIDWLKYEVKIPYVQAYRFMKISQEVDVNTLEKVGYRKLSDILELPPSEFRDNLIEMAQGLRRDDIKMIKKSYPQGDKSIEEGEIIDPSIQLQRALKLNADFLDAMSEVQLTKTPLNYLELLEGQLLQNVREVNSYIEQIRNVKSTGVSQQMEKEEIS